MELGPIFKLSIIITEQISFTELMLKKKDPKMFEPIKTINCYLSESGWRSNSAVDKVNKKTS